MSLTVLSAPQALAQLQRFDAVIDARSEDEFALDHLPGAINWPTLNNEERKVVGTLYVQVNPFEARKRGAAMAARNIAAHIEREALDKPREWTPLAYCWRGGQRSGALATILDKIGFRVHLIEGGYKAFRAAMLQHLPTLIAPLQFKVVCGTTGSGKTRLLHALKQAGAQVLDLEGLACHRSSVLGAIPGQPQPSQKHFDMLVWDALRQLDPSEPVYVESESKKIGNVAVPTELIERMRQSECLVLDLPLAQRVALLLEDYEFFVRDPAFFCQRLEALTTLRGHAVVNAWKEQVQSGNFATVVQDLLTQHYDPGYLQSMQRNFTRYPNALTLRPKSHSVEDMQVLAGEMVGR